MVNKVALRALTASWRVQEYRASFPLLKFVKFSFRSGTNHVEKGMFLFLSLHTAAAITLASECRGRCQISISAVHPSPKPWVLPPWSTFLLGKCSYKARFDDLL